MNQKGKSIYSIQIYPIFYLEKEMFFLCKNKYSRVNNVGQTDIDLGSIHKYIKIWLTDS